MKTQIKKSGDTIIVAMEGKLDFDTYLPLREDLNRLTGQEHQDSTPQKIIFNLENLDFVGSSGISSFIQTLKEFNSSAPQLPRYCNVKSEFRKVIQAFDESKEFQFYESEDRAIKSFNH
ncbi:MAG: STAS domain-containing protein [Bdellovibrionia bacterium]